MPSERFPQTVERAIRSLDGADSGKKWKLAGCERERPAKERIDARGAEERRQPNV